LKDKMTRLKESSVKKRNHLKNYFIQLIQSPTTSNNYDERMLLLETLSKITILEFHILISYSEFNAYINDIINNIEPSLRQGATSRLESLGLLQSFYIADTYVGQISVIKNISISEYGKKFIHFCL